MATAMMTNNQLRLIFNHGLGSEGNVITKNKNFNNVKTDATDDSLYAVAQSLAPLQQHPLNKIERNSAFHLVETTI